ncbi:MAG TPA: UDP-N-acetylmuramoyl-tripeptide--D-alanyl-D-alanine ligase [Casimicrobiaceae bacterium]|nr:UDP-N-acetylmuramoyl-tripeptide--D-alanyl-D-alanine ligase [Casimicrobiaceae bacterium]
MMDLATAARYANGDIRGSNATFARVCSDSRAIANGDLFVALAGERFDGHDYVRDALARGAVAALVSDTRAAALQGSLVVVDDTLSALGRLAAGWRGRFTLPLALVVGSNGKTTVKEMTAAALRAHFGDEAVLATQGNLNNAIGLPLTLLALSPEHRAAVIELGMNHRGETLELAPLAAPSIVVVNNAQREHQEFMSSVADVAAEHADAILALPRYGVAVINADDAYADVWQTAALKAGAKIVAFGTRSDADICGEFTLHADRSAMLVSAPSGRIEFTLKVPGRPMALNALAACATALAAGAVLERIAHGLEAFRPVSGRLETLRLANDATLIDDTYNANPDSVRAAIDVLARATGERWLVLGDMGEVGEQGPAYHREVGDYARIAGVDRLFTVGPLARLSTAAFGRNGVHFDDIAALIQALRAQVNASATMLVKGSRFMAMERVVMALHDEHGS